MWAKFRSELKHLFARRPDEILTMIRLLVYMVVLGSLSLFFRYVQRLPKIASYTHTVVVNLKNDFKESLSDRLYRIFFTIYFAQGALGLAGIAVPLYLKDIIGLSISQVATLQSLTVIPWLIKPVYGLVSDKCPVGGLRRKSYILICSALGFLGWFTIAYVAETYIVVFFAMVLANLGFAATDVVCDGLAVQVSTAETRGKIQAICWRSRSIGALLTGVAGGTLLEIISYQDVFAITMTLPLLVIFVGVSIQEEKVKIKASAVSVLTGLDELFKGFTNRKGSLAESYLKIKNYLAGNRIRVVGALGVITILVLYLYMILNPLMQVGYSIVMYWVMNATAVVIFTIISLILVLVGYSLGRHYFGSEDSAYLGLQPRNKELILAAIFIFVWNLTPAFGTPFLFFMREGLGFSTTMLGILSSIGSAGGVIGATVYKNKLTKVSLRKILKITILLGFVLTLAMLLVLNRETAMVIFFASGILGYIGFIPTMTLAAKACPKTIEASVFALLMSVANASGALAVYIGGQLFDVFAAEGFKIRMSELLATTSWGPKLFSLLVGEGDFNLLAIRALIFISALSALASLPLVKFLREEEPEEE